MRNYLYRGDRIQVESPGEFAPGDFVKLGSIHGFAFAGADTGEDLVVLVSGVFEADVQAAASVSVGDVIYATPGGALTSAPDDGGDPATEHDRVGVAVSDGEAAGGEAAIQIRLD